MQDDDLKQKVCKYFELSSEDAHHELLIEKLMEVTSQPPNDVHVDISKINSQLVVTFSGASIYSLSEEVCINFEGEGCIDANGEFHFSKILGKNLSIEETEFCENISNSFQGNLSKFIQNDKRQLNKIAAKILAQTQ